MRCWQSPYHVYGHADHNHLSYACVCIYILLVLLCDKGIVMFGPAPAQLFCLFVFRYVCPTPCLLRVFCICSSLLFSAAWLWALTVLCFGAEHNLELTSRDLCNEPPTIVHSLPLRLSQPWKHAQMECQTLSGNQPAKAGSLCLWICSADVMSLMCSTTFVPWGYNTRKQQLHPLHFQSYWKDPSRPEALCSHSKQVSTNRNKGIFLSGNML